MERGRDRHTRQRKIHKDILSDRDGERESDAKRGK